MHRVWSHVPMSPDDLGPLFLSLSAPHPGLPGNKKFPLAHRATDRLLDNVGFKNLNNSFLESTLFSARLLMRSWASSRST